VFGSFCVIWDQMLKPSDVGGQRLRQHHLAIDHDNHYHVGVGGSARKLYFQQGCFLIWYFAIKDG
jgi:hypothetical protein